MSCLCGPALIGKNDSQSKNEQVDHQADLVGIGLEYASLQLRLRLLMEHQRRAWPGSKWTEELEKRWSGKLDLVRDRMRELQWKAVDLPATELRELKAKATILLEATEDDPQNASAQLALSLCYDLILYSEAETPPDTNQDPERHLLGRKESAELVN